MHIYNIYNMYIYNMYIYNMYNIYITSTVMQSYIYNTGICTMMWALNVLFRWCP